MSGNQTLNPCGCCEGVEPLTPASVSNPPGLSALAWRVGTHSRFKETLLAALNRQPALRALTTRSDDDPAIALLDGWATVLDVLSFYQERIANEAYLRTAKERRSILELARAIGYELGPGVAASTSLAFTMETAPGAPTEATVPIGTKVQSIPGQDEKPQTFETVEAILARPEWNTLKPRAREHFIPGFGDSEIHLQGTATQLNPGDPLLFVGHERASWQGSERWDFRRVTRVEIFPEEDYTRVTLDRGLGSQSPLIFPASNPKVYALRQRAHLFGFNAQPWDNLPVALRVGEPHPQTGDPFIAGPFAGLENSWNDQPLPSNASKINLDAVYNRITKDSWIVLSDPTHAGTPGRAYVELYHVTDVVEENRADFLLSAATSGLSIEGENQHLFAPATTTVFGQSERLELADRPVTTPVSGAAIVLDRRIDGIEPGRLFIVAGINHATGEPGAETLVLARVEEVDGLTRLVFATALHHSYRRDSVVVHGNVAPATHGETKIETLGSGDATVPFQKFTLKQKPLTCVSSDNPHGWESTLKIRVNGVLWKEAGSFFDVGPDEHVYVTRLGDDGTVTVQFGDGVTGARLPSGMENVTATYRVGTGEEGLLKAGQLNLLMSRPLGLKEAVNPSAPSGGEDPERREDARRNAPFTVLTLGRIVSLQDYEDFARAFAGIGKARATLLWNGEQRLVHLTVSGVNGLELPSNSSTLRNLRDAIDGARHENHEVRLDPHQSKSFKLAAGILIDPSRVPEDVLDAVNQALLEGFAFEARGFGQAVTAAEVLAVMQRVDGVIAVDLDALHFSTETPKRRERLPANIARWASGQILPAELLTLDPEGIDLTEKPA